MLQILILAAITASIIFVGCNVRNYYRKAIQEDGLAPQVIPKSYYRSYFRDWFIFITIVVFVVWVVWNWNNIINFLKDLL